jgi:hypothetical protein
MELLGVMSLATVRTNKYRKAEMTGSQYRLRDSFVALVIHWTFTRFIKPSFLPSFFIFIHWTFTRFVKPYFLPSFLYNHSFSLSQSRWSKSKPSLACWQLLFLFPALPRLLRQLPLLVLNSPSVLAQALSPTLPQLWSLSLLAATITLDDAAVLAGTTLDLTKLTAGTHASFEGTTTFGYEEWLGSLISVSETSITVAGASGSVINDNVARWRDEKGANGGKTKPKFFYRHSLTEPTISGFTSKDSLVQLMNISDATTLTVSGLTMNHASGASLGHNTDAFDVGSSTGVAISGANVWVTSTFVSQTKKKKIFCAIRPSVNQDACLAINSGTCNGVRGLSIGSVGGRRCQDCYNLFQRN